MGASASRQRGDAEKVDDEAGVPLVAPESKENPKLPAGDELQIQRATGEGKGYGWWRCGVRREAHPEHLFIGRGRGRSYVEGKKVACGTAATKEGFGAGGWKEEAVSGAD